MSFTVQVPTGNPRDGKLVTVKTPSPTKESALAFALHQTRSVYNLRQFRQVESSGFTAKFSLVSDSRVSAYVTFDPEGY